MPSILITGANGFIGSHLVDKAIDSGFKVYAAVRKSSDLRFLRGKKIEFVYLNYKNKIELTQILNDIESLDYLIHNAGITNSKKIEGFFNINAGYTKVLVQALQASKHKLKRFVLMSSLAAIGSNDETDIPITDKDLPRPQSAYGASKLMSEEVLHAQSDILYTIIRPTAVYGSRDEGFRPIFKMINKGLRIYINSKESRVSFIHISDLVRAVFFLIDQPKSVKKSFILADGNNCSTEQFYGLIADALGKKKNLSIVIPKYMIWLFANILEFFRIPSAITKDKVNMMASPNWACLPENLNEMGFQPKIKLNKGVKSLIKYYIK